MYGFCNVWMCVSMGFVMCGCVCMCGFCNVWVCVCVCVGFVMCECFGNTCTCIYSVFVLIPLCIFLFFCLY